MSDFTFKTLGIPDYIIKSLEEIGYKQPTEIQSSVIPYLLEFNSDLIGQAQTGTGKTASFSIPIINRVNANDANIQSLILAPTRELCQQIQKEIFKLTIRMNKFYNYQIYVNNRINKFKI